MTFRVESVHCKVQIWITCFLKYYIHENKKDTSSERSWPSTTKFWSVWSVHCWTFVPNLKKLHPGAFEILRSQEWDKLSHSDLWPPKWVSPSDNCAKFKKQPLKVFFFFKYCVCAKCKETFSRTYWDITFRRIWRMQGHSAVNLWPSKSNQFAVKSKLTFVPKFF